MPSSGGWTSSSRTKPGSTILSTRSFSSRENIYVLLAILLVSVGYIVASIIRRKLQDRKAAERKRRLLGIPDATASSSSSKDKGSVIASMLDSVMPSLASRRGRSASTVAIKSDASESTRDVHKQANSSSTSSAASSNGKKVSGSVTSLATPLRLHRGRATSSSTAGDSPALSSSTLPISEHTTTANSRKTSRSVSNSTNSPSNSRQRDKATSLSYTKPKRSIGIQVPSESEDEQVQAETAPDQVQGISRRPSLALATTAAAPAGGKLAQDILDLPYPSHYMAAAKAMTSDRETSFDSPDSPASPPSNNQDGTSRSGPGRKARASLAKQSTKASIPGLSHSPARQPHQPGSASAGLSDSPIAFHLDLPAVADIQESAATSGAVSQAASRDQSLSGRSASWSISTDDTASTSLTSVSSNNGGSTSLLSGSSLLDSPVRAQQSQGQMGKKEIQPYCFHSSFQSSTADGAQEPEELGKAYEARRKREGEPASRYLPTPPDSQRKSRVDHNGYSSNALSMQQNLNVQTQQFFQPTPAKNSFDERPSDDAKHAQYTQNQQYLRQYQQMLQNGQYPHMPIPAYPSSQQGAPSTIYPGHSLPSSRSTSPLPGQPLYPPYSPGPSQIYSPGLAYPDAQQQQQYEAQAHQMNLLRNMQAMQAQLNYVQAGLYPSVGHSGMPLSPTPNMQFQLQSPGLAPQSSPIAGQLSYQNALSPITPASASFANGAPYSPSSSYPVASTSRNTLSRQQAVHSLPPLQSTSYADGTIVYRSGPKHKRQTSYTEHAVSTPPSSQSYKIRDVGRKLSKGSQRRPSINGSSTPDVPGSPTPSVRESLGDESLSYSQPRRSTYNSYKRRDSLAPPSPSLGAKKGSADLDSTSIEADLEVLRRLGQEEDLDEEDMRAKIQAMEAVLERRGKELEISNWKLKCVEVDRLNTENEHQKALNHFYERAERAEARLKLLESKPANGTPSTVSTASPIVQRRNVSQPSEPSEASTDERDEVSSGDKDQDEPTLSFTASSTAVTASFGSPAEYQSPISVYSPHIFSPHTGKPLRYPPHPLTRKGSKKGKRGRTNNSPAQPMYGRRASTSKSSDGSFDAFGDEDGEQDDSESDDLEIVMDSYSRSPSLAASNQHSRLPSFEPLDGASSSKTVGLGVMVSHSLDEEARTDGLPVNCVGSLPSFTFSRPPASPTEPKVTQDLNSL